MNALIDTGVLVGYLHGDRRAAAALDACRHRSISVVTWLEVMARCPAELREPTRAFLRSFERLSISEAIADDALRLIGEQPGLDLGRALTWASARINQLTFVTDVEAARHAGLGKVVLPYSA